MDFKKATFSIYEATANDATFTKECAEQEEEIKEDLESVMSTFKAVLSDGDTEQIYQLLDGTFLHMKETLSPRALNVERISLAVDKLSVDQLRRVSKDMREANAGATLSVLAVLCACLEENLEDECIVVSHTPTVAKRKPAGPMKINIATEAIEKVVLRFNTLKEQLAILRKHKSKGKKVLENAKTTNEPILRRYLETHNLDSQDVQCVSASESPSSSGMLPVYHKSLPKLPPAVVTTAVAAPIVAPNVVSPNVVLPNVVLPNVVSPNVSPDVVAPNVAAPNVASPNVVSPTVVSAPNVISVPNLGSAVSSPNVLTSSEEDDLSRPPKKRIAVDALIMENAAESKVLEVQRKVYTSRGKAPRLTEFTDMLPQIVSPVVKVDALSDVNFAELISKPSKKHILEKLLNEFHTLYNSTKGVKAEKIYVKPKNC